MSKQQMHTRPGCCTQSNVIFHVQADKRKKMSELLERHPFHNIINHGYGGNSMLISWSRLREFFDLALEITKDAEEFLQIEIKL